MIRPRLSAHLSESEQPPSGLLMAPLVCVWLLIFSAITLPERNIPNSFGSLDFLALSKVGARFVGLIVFSWLAWRSWDRPSRAMIMRRMWPFGLFLVWAIMSALWSPLRAVSLGQAGSMLVLWLLAVSIALLWKSEDDTSTVLFSVSLALLLYSLLMLFSYVALPSGEGGRFNFGLAHPATVGAAASLGATVLVAARLLWGWRWTRLMLAPGIVIYASASALSIDRTTIALAVVLIFLMTCALAHRGWTALSCLILSVVGVLYLTCDPGIEFAGGRAEATASLLVRGQTTRQLTELSGRSELWGLMWKSYAESPWIGHGYFVTSSTGSIDVWNRDENFTAHNTLFQVLVTTGAVGLAVFLWALWQPFWLSVRGLWAEREPRTMAIFSLVVAAWVVGWGSLDAGIVAQTLPPTVVCFVVFGIVVGQLAMARASFSRFRSRRPSVAMEAPA